MGKRQKKRWRYHYCHCGQVHQEMVANCEYREDGERVKWGRPIRSGMYMDQWNNDKPHNHEKSWKKKRKTQYRNRSEMVEHTIYLEDRVYKLWEVQRWFDSQDIPYRVEDIRKSHTRMRYYERRWVFIRNEPRIDWYKVREGHGKSLVIRWESKYSIRPIYGYREFKLSQPEVVKWTTVEGVKLTWWSDKDIGIQRVLNQYRWYINW